MFIRAGAFIRIYINAGIMGTHNNTGIDQICLPSNFYGGMQME